MKFTLVKRGSSTNMDRSTNSPIKQHAVVQNFQKAFTETMAPTKRPNTAAVRRSSAGNAKRVLDFDEQTIDASVNVDVCTDFPIKEKSKAKPKSKSKPRVRPTKAKKCNAPTEISKTVVADVVPTIDDIFEFVAEMEDKEMAPQSTMEPPMPEKKNPRKRSSDEHKTPAVKKTRVSKSSTAPPEEELEIFIENGYVCNKYRIKGRRLTRIRTNKIDVPYTDRLIPIDSKRYTIFSSLCDDTNQWISTLHIHNEDTFIETGTKLIKITNC